MVASLQQLLPRRRGRWESPGCARGGPAPGRRAHSPGAGAGDHAAERAAPSRTSRLA